MRKNTLTKADQNRIDAAIKLFTEHYGRFDSFAQALVTYFQNDPVLAPLIHFIKYRVKDPEHLREKLIRKCVAGDIVDVARLFEKITDLAGVRILHLHTEQMRIMHPAILAVFDEQNIKLVEPPVANCWDVEYESLFNEFGLNARRRESMYTTVHYVVRANQRAHVTCEVQVRTIMDEAWGEVSHRVNYPQESPSRGCKDQLKILARITSGCTRLVDEIFRSDSEARNAR